MFNIFNLQGNITDITVVSLLLISSMLRRGTPPIYRRAADIFTRVKLMTVTVYYGHPKMSDMKLAKNLFC